MNYIKSTPQNPDGGININSATIEPVPGEYSPGTVFTLLEDAAKRMKKIHRKVIEKTGITPSQFQILSLLQKRDKQSLGDLAKQCKCTKATITGIIDTMEKKALVKRIPNPADRRGLLARLTSLGRTLHSQTPELNDVLDCCDGLSKTEFNQLGQLLAKLNRSISCIDHNE